MNNNLDEKIQAVKDELVAIQELYEFTQKIKAENEIEQEKIVQQNLTLKHQRDELLKDQRESKVKETDLNEREKMILIREKSQLASNKLLDEKLEDFRIRTHELNEQILKFKKDLEEYKINKAKLDRQIAVNKKLEETESYRKDRIKKKEEEVEQELSRLRNLHV